MVFFDQRVKVALKLMIFVIFFVCSLSRSAALCTLAHITARASEPEMGGGGWVIFVHPFFIRSGLEKVCEKGGFRIINYQWLISSYKQLKNY